ncbi:hypothetical protein [Corynebacterium urogenitale]|nr:hypothetical protein [Corynebacterium urogenitale]
MASDNHDRTNALTALGDIDRMIQRAEAEERTRATPVIALVIISSIIVAITTFCIFLRWQPAAWIGVALLCVLVIATTVLSKKLNVSRSSLQDPLERRWSPWSLGIALLPLSLIISDIIEDNNHPWWGYLLAIPTAGVCGYSYYQIGMADIIHPGQQRDQLNGPSAFPPDAANQNSPDGAAAQNSPDGVANRDSAHSIKDQSSPRNTANQASADDTVDSERDHG